MKAVILAAGRGMRLNPLTENLPKCLIEIEGQSLLERSLANLEENGINGVIIVIGFQEHAIKQKIGSKYHGIPITYVTNKSYLETESMYSFSHTKPLINEDILLLESDLLYEKKAIEILLNSKFKNVILVADLLHSGDDVYVCVNEKQQIINLGKHISDENKKQAIGCLVGISMFSQEFLSVLFKKAKQDYNNNKLNYHYEKYVFETSRLGNPVYVEFCKDLRWIEIDNENDLKKAQEVVYPKIFRSYRKMKRNILLKPGPATTTDRVKMAQVGRIFAPGKRNSD